MNPQLQKALEIYSQSAGIKTKTLLLLCVSLIVSNNIFTHPNWSAGTPLDLIKGLSTAVNIFKSGGVETSVYYNLLYCVVVFVQLLDVIFSFKKVFISQNYSYNIEIPS